ncbi:MAG: MMPL family transporter, partial [Gemmatimonadota bacterium]|nr:MMPL family transporter [Gemmatimonadota bacterium]
MSPLLARLARTITHRWKRALVAAFAVLILLGAAAGAGGPVADDFEVPGAESQQALDLFRAHSPALAGADASLVFTVDEGKIDDPENRAAIEGALGEVRKLDGIDRVPDPFAADGGSISPDERLASVDVRYTTEVSDLEKEDGEALLEAARTAEPQVEVSARGWPIDLASEQTFPVGELVGIAIAIVLLTLLFRSGSAMAATLVGALLGVMVGQMLLTALATPLGLPAFASVLAMMLGLGAGIDYALLIIGRYREQVAAGDSTRDASAKAAATSGASVLAAGLIVMVAIAGLLVIGIPFIGKLGLAAAIAVGAVVVSALTVLPIMIGALQRWLKPRKPEHVLPSRAFQRWGERVTARPWLSIAGGVLVLVILAFPVSQMRLGLPDDGNQPESRTQRVAYDELSKAFGAGSTGPFLIAVDTPKGAP